MSGEPQSADSMPVDPDEGLVTDLMLAMMVVFGVDTVGIVGFMWLSGYVSTLVFVGVAGLVVGSFGCWIGWRWRAIRRIESATDPERTPLDELKHRYAAGEISEATFERKLDRLVDIDMAGDREPFDDASETPVDRAEEETHER